MFLLSSISHDLKTPINAVLAFNKRLKRIKNLTQEEVKLLEMQESSCLYMISLIEDI